MDIYGFLELLKFAKVHAYNQGEQLLMQDQTVNQLLVIKKGSVGIKRDKTLVTELGQGFFLGEMSFLTGNVASASVEALDSVECFVWDEPSLAKIKKWHSELYVEIKEAASLNLVKKIVHNLGYNSESIR